MKTPINESQEATAVPAAAIGVKLVIKSIEKDKSKGASGTDARGRDYDLPAGLLQYVVTFTVLEPKKYKGDEQRWWCVVGTEEDPNARRDVWDDSRDWPHMVRLLRRSETTIARDGDDEDWMAAAEGREICAHTRVDGKGFMRLALNKQHSFYKENDPDFVGVGNPVEGAAVVKPGRGAGKKGPAAARVARGEDTEEDTPRRVVRAVGNDED